MKRNHIIVILTLLSTLIGCGKDQSAAEGYKAESSNYTIEDMGAYPYEAVEGLAESVDGFSEPL